MFVMYAIVCILGLKSDRLIFEMFPVNLRMNIDAFPVTYTAYTYIHFRAVAMHSGIDITITSKSRRYCNFII